jgi:hypothetical protein
MFILGHNLKDFNVKYGPSGYSTAFANVVGINGAITGVTETVFADNTSYYEFDSVTTTGIRLTMNKTQTANQEKYVSQVILTNEIGTLTGYPKVSPIVVNRNLRVSDMLSGRKNVVKSIETLSFNLDLDPYPAAYGADINLLLSLADRDDPFLSWLCGGRRGSTYFTYTLRGFRLQDVIPTQIVNEVEEEYVDNIYVAPVQTSFSFQEVTL